MLKKNYCAGKNITIDIAGIHFNNNKNVSKELREKKTTMIRGIPESIFILPANVEFVNREYRVSKITYAFYQNHIYVRKIKYQN